MGTFWADWLHSFHFLHWAARHLRSFSGLIVTHCPQISGKESWKLEEKTEKQLRLYLGLADSSALVDLCLTRPQPPGTIWLGNILLSAWFLSLTIWLCRLCSSFIPGLITAGSFWGTFWWWSGESSQTASPPPCHTLGVFIFIRTFIAALSPQSISRQHSTLDREQRDTFEISFKSPNSF